MKSRGLKMVFLILFLLALALSVRFRDNLLKAGLEFGLNTAVRQSAVTHFHIGAASMDRRGYLKLSEVTGEIKTENEKVPIVFEHASGNILNRSF